MSVLVRGEKGGSASEGLISVMWRKLVLCHRSFSRTQSGGGGAISPAVFQERRAEGKINMVKSENTVPIRGLNLKIEYSLGP